jgi:hypothetical protein
MKMMSEYEYEYEYEYIDGLYFIKIDKPCNLFYNTNA